MTEIDAGLQNERTALSWHRTALSLSAAAAAITRVTYSSLGRWSLVCLAVTAPLIFWVFWESRARYVRSHDLRSRGSCRDGVAAASLALATVAIGLTELAALTAP